MKNIIFILLCSILIVGCMVSSRNNQTELKCSVDIEIIESEIKEMFKADSVVIYARRLKEEVFFPELKSPVVVIWNATTNILDFKKIPSEQTRFDNYSQIEDGLKKEGLPIAKKIMKECEMSDYNDLIIEFHEKHQEGKVGHRFICHYKELFK